MASSAVAVTVQDLLWCRTEAQQDSQAQLTRVEPRCCCKITLTNFRMGICGNLLFGFVFFYFFVVVESNCGLQRAATLLQRLRQRLSFVQLQANKLLHALPVLHLSGAVGVILT